MGILGESGLYAVPSTPFIREPVGVGFLPLSFLSFFFAKPVAAVVGLEIS